MIRHSQDVPFIPTQEDLWKLQWFDIVEFGLPVLRIDVYSEFQHSLYFHAGQEVKVAAEITAATKISNCFKANQNIRRNRFAICRLPYYSKWHMGTKVWKPGFSLRVGRTKGYININRSEAEN